MKVRILTVFAIVVLNWSKYDVHPKTTKPVELTATTISCSICVESNCRCDAVLTNGDTGLLILWRYIMVVPEFVIDFFVSDFITELADVIIHL